MKRFNLAKEQRKLNRKNNLANNIKIRTIILSIFVLVGSIMLFTYSKYSTSVKLDIMHSKVANFLQDDYIVNAYVDGDEDDFPGKNDGYIVDNVTCNKGATGTWNDTEWGLLITGATEEETECNVYFKTIQTVYNFEFDPDNDGQGQVQTFTVPVNGIYKIELWGASGGDGVDLADDGLNGYANGGYGGYTKGDIELSKDNNLYIYVGGAGVTRNYTQTIGATSGGYNGGADGYMSRNRCYKQTSGGGGATDVRITNGSWDNFNSLKSRIMVAGGGGGIHMSNCSSSDQSITTGGAGGGLNGSAGVYLHRSGYSEITPTGGTQTTGGQSVDNWTATQYTNNYIGSFGKGAQGNNTNYSSSDRFSYGGGGSGYYGGASGGWKSGGGGSSFISGYSGCNAIDYSASTSSTSIVHKNQSKLTINDKTYEFTNAEMIDGNGCTWSSGSATGCGSNQTQPNGSKATGHTGDGFARITLLSRS